MRTEEGQEGGKYSEYSLDLLTGEGGGVGAKAFNKSFDLLKLLLKAEGYCGHCIKTVLLFSIKGL